MSFSPGLQGSKVIGSHTLKEFFPQLKRPRKVMLMVKAGEPVDELIEECLPFLEKGDILIDGGNSHYVDTERREKELRERDSCSSALGFPAEKRERAMALRSCPEEVKKHGLLSSRFSKRLLQKPMTAVLAAIGSETAEPATMSRWSITALNMATCS